jgi:sulfite reductase (NADPH) hemoprotein beta-component
VGPSQGWRAEAAGRGHRRINTYFAPPALEPRAEGWGELAACKKSDPGFAEWVGRNVAPHRHPDYAMVTIS